MTLVLDLSQEFAKIVARHEGGHDYNFIPFHFRY